LNASEAREPKPARLARGLGWAAILLALLGPPAPGCSPTQRYEVLSFFFDGVPEPGAEAKGARRVSPQLITDQPADPSLARPAMRVHEPYRQGQCTTCHPKQASFFLGEDFDRRGLCFGCHQPFRQKLDGLRRVHGPVAAGYCLVCHDPHESLHPGLAVEADPRLCHACHDRDDVLAGAAHRDIGDGKCLPCHDAHGSDAPALLRSGWSPPAPPEEDERHGPPDDARG
jgi:predicted CXXCH cytochrome family protein